MSRARRHVISVSLFPFLAVLICIMGALVIILVLMVARVGDGAAHVASATAPETPADDREQRERIEDARWKRELLEKNRSEKQQELADRRAELAHLEDHISRLQAEARQQLERAKSIDEGRQLRAEDLDKTRQEVARLRSEAEKKRREIDAQKQKQAGQGQSYTLIPYDGPNGTRRRPIYLECTEIGITLQPEGVTFRFEDFQGPLGPGNPLDAALRRIRDQLAQGGGKSGEPYPLLVVRPGGIIAYTAARAALKSWDDEFGYELLGDDKQLDFGQPDPAAAAELEKTIVAARRRQSLLAAAMPRGFAGSSLGSHGGSGDGGVGGAPPGAAYGQPGAGYGPASEASNGGGGAGSSNARPAKSSKARAFVAGQNPNADPRLPSTPQYFHSSGDAVSGHAESSLGGVTGGQEPPLVRNSTVVVVEPTAPASGAAHTDAATPGGSPGFSSLTRGADGMPQRGDAASPTVGVDAGKLTQGSGKSGKSGDGKDAPAKKSNRPNWAVPQARVNSMGVTRPIQVAVLPDRLVIVPERGDNRLPHQIPISPQLAPQEVDAFVAAIQSETKNWGLAVKNGYWKPQLIIDVAPAAEEQCRDLQMALENSGFDMQRKLR